MKRLAIVLAFSVSALAQQPRVTNAKIENRPAGNLEATFHSLVAAQDAPVWVAYSVPAVPGHGDSCCWNDGYRGCGLEGRITTPVAAGPVLLEGSSTLVVLFRVANRAVEKVRMASAGCDLDAGGLPFIILDGVKPGESVALLSTLVTAKRDQALSAIAMHADPAAVASLLALAKNDPTPHIRGQALFWLAHRAGQKETAAITDAIANDPSTEVKKKAVFALQQLPKDEGIPLLIQLARTNKNAEVRKQAMFWLGQSKDPRAVSFFEEILGK
ncbi:MAG: lyase domain protein repeat-containing protein [Bryobacterales bacterium]|nr:lyase domain protein repeat-containing protein [Bryobacterales bacterium]